MLCPAAVSRCTLHIGDYLLLSAVGGAPEAEYALFDPGEIELQATGPGSIRETGYRTVVGEARARLADLGVTSALADEAAAAFRPNARAYARGAAARCVVDRLEAAELFEGRTFDAGGRKYEGSWLDLPVLATDLALQRGPATLQALHLAAVLSERAEQEPVTLATAELGAVRRPGERTYRRASLDDPEALMQALRSLKAGPPRTESEEGPGRADVLGWLRERARWTPVAREKERLATLEAAFEMREAPPRGPLAETALWAIDCKLSRGEAAGVLETLDAIERRRGRVPGTTYLRARLALITGSEEPQSIADRVSALSTSMPSFHELELLAAQACAAAGDARRARAFARDLVDNATASDTVRMQAREVLAAAGESSSNLVAAPVPAIRPQPVGSVHAPPAIPRAPRPPSGTALEPISSSPPSSKSPPTAPSAAPRAPTRTATSTAWPAASSLPESRPSSSRPSTRPGPPGASLPPYRVEPRGERAWSVPPPHAADVERVEALSVPPGMHGDPPPSSDERPRSPAAARLTFTYLARELGRELRVRHGVELRSDVDGLELAQRYLREAIPEGRVRGPEDEREVMRQGAFLSELVARHLGARWADLDPEDPGRWAMLVPSTSRPDEVARVWPFGRVLRFVASGHKERDLVSYYLELEARAR
jgi:hypothetical protein